MSHWSLARRRMRSVPSPTPQSLLDVLSKPRLVALGREIGVSVAPSATKEAQVAVLAGASPGLSSLLRSLGRDELRAACRAHGLDDSGRSRPALMARLLEAADAADASLPVAAFTTLPIGRSRPEAGDVVRVRHRVYLVEEVVASPLPGEATRVLLAGLDDDNQGRRLEVLWEIELGARLLHDQHGLGTVSRLDPPRPFAAYLHALRWNVVTATEARLFQAPFRAGIRLFDYQLTPLKKALELPRANLFIADDVGLGKTIEAGLILQELTLRQQVDFVLVVCPASLCLQWRDEMERRFGLRFEVYNRAFVAQRRQERGFAVNPWTTHNRFILSYPLLRRPEYRDLLVQRLGDRCRKSLLVLDEAHTAAPASASVYAVDSAVTRAVRDDVAPRFENRLFLSATPHNGHSNSFSALLEILDPQRFTRGVPVRPGQLEAVMVRRLKSDLRAFGGTKLPHRRIVEIDLTEEEGRWRASSRGSATGDPAGPAGELAGDAFAAAPLDLGSGEPLEIELSRLLAEYTELMRPHQARRAQLVFIHLQKRLLSSVAAFWRTLKLHAENVGPGVAKLAAAGPDLADSAPLLFSHSAGSGGDDDEYGVDEETAEDAAGAEVAGASRRLPSPAGRARALLDEMLRRAEAGRHQPDAKVRALLAWMRRYQDPPGGWSDRRVLVFTEYGDTLRYLYRQLRAEIDGTPLDDRRILMFHGGLLDDRREALQRAFNSPPGEDPVRILLATDAAREGVNLQGHCADLFHFDIPWNPARMEQRNGRIDRTLQPSPEVRCHYFFYPQRSEDRVLSVLVGKVETIRKELGSLSDLLLGRFAEVLDRGLSPTSEAELRAAEAVGGRTATVREELESERADRAKLGKEIDDAGKILAASRQLLELDADLLRETLDAGLALAGAPPLSPVPSPPGDPPAFVVPPLPANWQATLDTLRPARARDEPPWEWRRRPLLPVVFDPLERLDGSRVHLHLQHPFVQRVLAPFLAQGYGAHDLSRVTALRDRHGDQVMAIAFGRLSLFGPGATRLHDELLTVAAPWFESRGPEHLAPLPEAAEQKVRDRLDRLFRQLPGAGDPQAAVPAGIQTRLAATAAADFAALWPHVRDEADARVHEAERKLNDRAAKESTDLRRLLEAQRSAIRETLKASPQLTLTLTPQVPREREQIRQIDEDRAWQERRLVEIDRELTTEPEAVAGLYKIALRRLEPVGLVYLWPETRT